jgi:oxalate decarboxylase/phosphoglucose isomerase-like protein (cupin superfamily)
MCRTTSKQAIILHEEDVANTTAESFPDPSTGGNVEWKTLISRPKTDSDTFTVGVATCPPSTTLASRYGGHLKLHRHTHAEIYHVISGCGVVCVDGTEHAVRKGSVVYIPGDAEHGIWNTGEDELTWLYVFAADGFEDVVYRFSGDGAVKARL